MQGIGLNITSKVDGLKELDKALNALPLRMRGNALRGALNKAANPIVKDARAMVPVKTGQGKRSIRKRASTPRGSNGYQAVVTVGFLQRAFYLQFVELGTSKLAARPFLRPAFDKNMAEFSNIFKKELRARIEKARR